ncbi:MAG: hypothetical protein U0572_13290 [Phycisphaerales bacterium]
MRSVSPWRRGVSYASILALLVMGSTACQSTPSGADTASRSPSQSVERYDPLQGDYPQVLWMVNIFDVPAAVEVRGDGTVVATTNPKPKADATVGPERIDAVFSSIEAIPGAALSSSPAAIARFDTDAKIAMGSTDKAGARVDGCSIAVRGTDGASGVVATTDFESSAGALSTSRHLANRAIPRGGALVWAVPGARPEDAWKVIVLRPTVLRSVEDYPFQTATSLDGK